MCVYNEPMRDLSTYPVSFPYGATSSPYSPSKPHSGEDRAGPKGTPIIISGTLIGTVGTTGKSTGPHTHIQKKVNGTITNPKGQGLNITGEVIEAGFNSEIGNFVRVRDNSGVIWSYFHMDERKVKVGDKVGGNMYEGKSAQEWYKVANDWHQRADDRQKVIETLENKIQDLEKQGVADPKLVELGKAIKEFLKG